MTTNKATKFYPFDWLITGYSMLMILLFLLLGRPLIDFADEISLYLLIGVTPLAVGYLTRGKVSTIAQAIRWLYPVVLFAPFYRLTASHIFLLFNHFFDAKLVALEASIFSIEPTLFIDKHSANPLFTELVTFCYACYYLMIPIFAIVMFRAKRLTILADALTAICLMFFVSFLVFFLFPIEGPRWFEATQYMHPIRGYIFRPLVEFIQREASVHGGGMPSSHTGVALVIVLYTSRINKRWGMILAAIVCGLGLGAVWGRYHYVSDIVVGAAIGALSVIITDRFLSSESNTIDTTYVKETSIAHVS